MNKINFSASYRDFKNTSSELESGEVKAIWDGNGWHYYSMLKIRWDNMTAERRKDVGRMVSMYTNYNRAAVAAAEIIATHCQITCEVLEHQGNVIHFFFPELIEKKSEVIRIFGHLLNYLVEVYVRRYYEDDVTQFHMAAQFGRSVLVRVASIETANSSDSTVSLGPCANSPAKQMGESTEETTRPLWWRKDDVSQWCCEDCSDLDAASICHISDLIQANYREGYFETIPTEQKEASKSAFACVEQVPESTPDNPKPVEGFFFRADMDGFTKKIKDAYKKGRDEVWNVVEEFVLYMTEANNWEAASDMQVVPFPWAGDCFNALILPIDQSKGWRGGFDMSRKSQPLAIVEEWERSIVTGKGDSDWAYSVSGGDVFQFSVETREREFKLAVGRPAGLTLAAIHFNNIPSGALVMHKNEIEKFDEATRKEFQQFPNGRHPNFKWLSESDRSGLKKRVVAAVAIKARAHDDYHESRPWHV